MIADRASDAQDLDGGEPATTNNRMELLAVIEALQSLAQPVKARVYTDSQYVQKGISEWIHNWKKRGWKTSTKEPVKNEDLWRRLDALVPRPGAPGGAAHRRASDECIFMLMGELIEHRRTEDLFLNPSDRRTADYIEGRYG